MVYKDSINTVTTVPCQTVKGIMSQAQFENSKQSSLSERTIIVDVRHREPRAVACFPVNITHTQRGSSLGETQYAGSSFL